MKTNAMRGILLVGILMMASGFAWSAEPYYRLIPDSIRFYTYNSQTNNMDLSAINYNYYSNGLPDSTITTNGDRIPVAKTSNIFVESSITESLSFVAGENGWVPSQRQEYFYDDMNNLVKRIVTRWRDDHWENLNTFTYIYDNFNRLVVYNREFWRDSWIDFTADSLFYDEEGLLTERSARYKSTGQYITRMLYQYNISTKKIFQTRQDFVNNVWTNVSRVSYFYNHCGTQISTGTDRWINGSWQMEAGTETFFSIQLLPGARKVPVCHNGNTILVVVAQLAAYLAHGDCLGSCVDPGPIIDDETEMLPLKSRSLPFIVYPNPASEFISIRMVDQECPATRIELLDYYGRLIKTVNPSDQNVITLDLNSLKSGNYILRVTAETIYSTVISKK